ncbi:uncharacterized protein C8R40DRAFT_1110305 [Lentinula edodes]|uniref:uncharacterized protein n=1 Tax=Lentinula edodes TaxID=5353 RepID=UPI001BF9BEBA|nr:uncharacterized protein C8R40DRAFT_1110305 [Lentinula edodes]KAF8830751.1 hypothetical protein HHX47_DHR2001194 [Lentinula edodes]KAH7874292.1 hypothetical protein C8R40DRAFT_1110305 [Lentinula edodes]
MVLSRSVLIAFLVLGTAFVLAAPVHEGSKTGTVLASRCAVNQPLKGQHIAGSRRSPPDQDEHLPIDFLAGLPQSALQSMISHIQNTPGYVDCKMIVDKMITDWRADPNNTELRSEIAYYWDKFVQGGKGFTQEVAEMRQKSEHYGDSARSG